MACSNDCDDDEESAFAAAAAAYRAAAGDRFDWNESPTLLAQKALQHANVERSASSATAAAFLDKDVTMSISPLKFNAKFVLV
jgi:hypothetical protein